MTYSNTSTASTNNLSEVVGAIQRLGVTFLTPPNVINHPKYGLGGEHADDREELKELQKLAAEYIKTAPDSRHAYNEIFKAVYGSTLKLDSWNGTVYSQGCPVVASEDLTYRLARIIHREPPNRAEFILAYDRTCRQNTKNPVAAYLEGLAYPEPVTTRVMDEDLGYTVSQTTYPEPVTPETFPEFADLAKHCFGDQATPLDNTLLTRWLVSAVARAVKPGCKADSALVLKGAQGIGKTSFFQTLATIPNPLSSQQEPVSYFGTLLPRKTVETQQELQQLWIAEMGEVESTFRQKDISELKAFLTETTDLYRAPYARTPQKHPRHTAFCATTNQESFLTDGTGSRRFWVIDCGSHSINLDWVAANRDAIWACAYHLYLKGEQWHLTADESDLSESRNAAYQSSTGYEDTLAPFIAALEELGTKREVSYTLNPADILTHVLQVPPASHSKHSRKLGETMKALGYERKRVSIAGQKLYRYIKTDSTLELCHASTEKVQEAQHQAR